MNPELRYVIHYCFLRKLTGDETLCEMEKAYGRNAPSRASIFNWFKKFKDGKKDIDDAPRSGKPQNQEYKLLILDALEKEPHASTIRLEDITGINKSTIWNILTDQMHYKLYISKWIPYPIREDIKEKRVKMAVDILNVLEKGETAWMDTITGDESWFFWAYEHDQQWLPEGSERPKIPKPNIWIKKRYFRFILAFVDLY